MITKVRLKNWKSHLDSEFDFTGGVNALVGINGAGKSSVLDAVSFALFGTFPNHSNRKIGLDDLIMGRPAKKDEAEVYLEFFSGGKRYSVFRRIMAGKGTVQAEIREEGRLIEVNPSSVTSHIETILQMDYPLFSKAVYSEQNSIDYFLTIPKGKRMQHIDRMLDLERFEAVRNALGSVKNIIQAKLSEKLRALSELQKEGIKEKMGICHKNIGDIESGKKSAESGFSTLKVEMDEINLKLSETEAKEKNFLDAERRLAELKAAYKQVSAILDEKASSIGSESLESIIKKIENLKNNLAGIENQLTQNKEIGETFRDKIAFSNSEIKNINQALSDLEKIKGPECPVCENELPSSKKSALFESRKKRLDGLRKSLETEIKEIRLLKDKNEVMEREYKQKTRELEKLNFIISDFEIIDRMKNQSATLSLEIKKLEIGKNSLQKEILELDIKSLRSGLSEKSRQFGELQYKISASARLLEKERQILDSLLERQASMDSCIKRIDNLSGMASMADRFSGALRRTQEQLREEFTKLVNTVIADVWADLYPYSDFESLRLSVDSGDYVLEAKNMQAWIPVDGFASGGERSLACLALRVAFSLAFIPKLKWLILDEPTHNLDLNSIQKFSSVLGGSMQKFVNQIFLITHEAKLIEDVEGAVYRLERDKSANGVTKVVKI